MRSKVNFDLNELNEECLQKSFHKFGGIVYIQDTIHIGTKLRNRLLSPSVFLPMGNRQVSISHVKMLLSLAPKEEHGIVYSDICPEDRQNFGSLEKIMRPRVLQSLEKYVYGSEATVMYLRIAEQITSSFLNPELKSTDRIYRIWHSVYFLRIWKKWLKLTRNEYDAAANFISSNAYACIEINAHGLVYATQKLRNELKSNLFIPSLFASQPCEHLFRQLRSMGTTNYTKINFTLYEIFHLISRVDLMNEIIFLRLNKENICFPRTKKIFGISHSPIQLPTDEEICQAMKNAQKDAMKTASDFGMQVDVADISKCELIQISLHAMETEEEEFFDPDDDEEEIFVGFPDDETVSHSKYIELINEDGSVKSIRKSTLVWLLTETKSKLSSDRLKRVQEAKNDDSKRRKHTGKGIEEFKETIILKSHEVEIGDWCFFKYTPSNFSIASLTEQNIMENGIIGVVIAFRYNLEKDTRPKPKLKKYLSDFASVAPEQRIENENVQVLATWYVCNNEGILCPVRDNNHFYININNYVATMENLIVEGKNNSQKCLLIPPTELIDTRSMLLKHFLQQF